MENPNAGVLVKALSEALRGSFANLDTGYPVELRKSAINPRPLAAPDVQKSGFVVQ
jgi:hypothetical protein